MSAATTLEEAWLDGGPAVPLTRGWLSPRAAFQEAIRQKAILVDIRDPAQRAAEGEINPILGALVIDPLLLEWRFDPRSETRLPEASYDARVVLIGDESAAARAAHELRALGVEQATHVSGGFTAWREAGMPTGR